MNKFLLVHILFPVLLSAQSAMVPVKVNCVNDEGEAMPGEQILFKELNTKKIYKGISDAEGKAELEIKGPGIYMIKLKSVGEAQDYTKFSVPPLKAGQSYGTYNIDVEIQPARDITLDHVYFETGKAVLKKESFAELDELYELLRLKEKMRIEIGGHTDNEGSDESNQLLSLQRAESVRTYLVNKGIKKDRIQVIGYGESQPIADNGTSEGRSKNRRTEVRILK